MGRRVFGGLLPYRGIGGVALVGPPAICGSGTIPWWACGIGGVDLWGAGIRGNFGLDGAIWGHCGVALAALLIGCLAFGMVVVLLSSLIPAERAARVKVARALQYE